MGQVDATVAEELLTVLGTSQVVGWFVLTFWLASIASLQNDITMGSRKYAEDYFGLGLSLLAAKPASGADEGFCCYYIPMGEIDVPYADPEISPADLKQKYAEFTERVKQVVQQHATTTAKIPVGAGHWSVTISDKVLGIVQTICQNWPLG